MKRLQRKLKKKIIKNFDRNAYKMMLKGVLKLEYSKEYGWSIINISKNGWFFYQNKFNLK